MTDTEDHKLFCGGLHLSTDEHGLRDYFSSYGEVTFSRVNSYKDSKESRGFGFVSFKQYEDMKKCLEESPHIIDGKQVEVKIAEPREKMDATNKVFLGGVSPETTKQDILDALAGTGITGAQVMTKKHTEEPRGFAFAYFDSVKSAKDVVRKGVVDILDRKVECKAAKPKDDAESNRYSNEGPPSHHGRHSGYGDYYASYGRSHPAYGYGPPGGYGYSYPGNYGYGGAPGYPPSSYDVYPSSRGYMGGPGMSYSQNPSAYGPSRHTANRNTNAHPYSRR